MDRNSTSNINENRQLTFMLQIYCFLLPFEEILVGSFGSIIKIIGICIMGYIALVYKRIVLYKDSIWLIIWILFAGISVLWCESTEWWLEFFKIYASQVAFFIVVTSVPVRDINLSSIRKTLLVSSMLAALMLIFAPQNSQYTEEGRRTITMFARSFDPNVLSGVILLGIASALEELFLLKSGWKQFCMLFSLLICCTGIFFTGSRGGLLAAFFTIFVVLILKARKHNSFRRARWIVAGITLAAIIIVPILPSSILTERFSASTILGLNEFNAGVHNRYSIWLSAIKLVPQKPVLGYGLGNFLTAITTVYFRECSSHNMFLLVLVEMGLVGLVLFGIFLVSILKKLWKMRAYSGIGQLLGILFLCTTLDGLPFKFFWTALILSQMTIRSVAPK